DAGPFSFTGGGGTTGNIPVGAVPANGTTYLKGIAIDTSTLASGCSTSAFAYVSDNTAPTPTAPTTASNPSNIVQPTLTGTVSGTSEANATIHIRKDGGHGCTGTLSTLIGTGTADGTGHFSVAVTTALPNDGTFTLYAKATDVAGNTAPSSCSSSLTYTTDNT